MILVAKYSFRLSLTFHSANRINENKQRNMRKRLFLLTLKNPLLLKAILYPTLRNQRLITYPYHLSKAKG